MESKIRLNLIALYFSNSNSSTASLTYYSVSGTKLMHSAVKIHIFLSFLLINFLSTLHHYLAAVLLSTARQTLLEVCITIAKGYKISWQHIPIVTEIFCQHEALLTVSLLLTVSVQSCV